MEDAVGRTCRVRARRGRPAYNLVVPGSHCPTSQDAAAHHRQHPARFVGRAEGQVRPLRTGSARYPIVEALTAALSPWSPTGSDHAGDAAGVGLHLDAGGAHLHRRRHDAAARRPDASAARWLGLGSTCSAPSSRSRTPSSGRWPGTLVLWSIPAVQAVTGKEGMGPTVTSSAGCPRRVDGLEGSCCRSCCCSSLVARRGHRADLLARRGRESRFLSARTRPRRRTDRAADGDNLHRWLVAVFRKRTCFSVGLTGGVGSAEETIGGMLSRAMAPGSWTPTPSRMKSRSRAAWPSKLSEPRSAGRNRHGRVAGPLVDACTRIADPGARARLEAILHPLIRAESNESRDSPEPAARMPSS